MAQHCVVRGRARLGVELDRTSCSFEPAAQPLEIFVARSRSKVPQRTASDRASTLGSATEAAMILGTVPIAFVGGILALLLARETWNVSSLVGLIGLFGIAVQNSLVLVTQTRGLLAEGRPLLDAVREASIGRVRPKLMTATFYLQVHGWLERRSRRMMESDA